MEKRARGNEHSSVKIDCMNHRLGGNYFWNVGLEDVNWSLIGEKAGNS